ncbi:MAG: pyruvate formate lyase family protein [Pseudomonadota bacterium]
METVREDKKGIESVIVPGGLKGEEIGAWQQMFQRTCSERIKKAIDSASQTPEFCLERARAEIKALEQYKDEPRIIQRARTLEIYLREKTLFINEGELIVGNFTSKVRASPIFAELYGGFLDRELDDPVRDYAVRKWDKYNITPEVRKELRETIIPYFRGKTISDYSYGELADDEVKEKSFVVTASCHHIPSFADLKMDQDAGHQLANYEKVLCIGLRGIREEVEWYMARLEEPYNHSGVQERRDFYRAVLITLDAAIAYSKRYAELARRMAVKETDARRRSELERIAEVCERVPEHPAKDWREALQSVFMLQVVIHCEMEMGGNSFGRFDQYLYPYYKKSVIDDKTMTRDDALELLECFWVKANELTQLQNYDVVPTGAGFPSGQNLLLGGQTRDGRDAVNELSWLCLEAEEQVGLGEPDVAIRIWEGTPQAFLKKCAEIIRLGRGKLKFYSDRKALQMLAKPYPDRTIEDLRDYAVIGCVELSLPHITQNNSMSGISIVPKILELVINNGKCALCGKQIGPLTGKVESFESIEAVRQAFRTQVFYWMEQLVKGSQVEWNGHYDKSMTPFCSSLLEGPLQKGKDLIQGGAWYTLYGLWLTGLADTADSLGVIDRLIYRDKKVTWGELKAALQDNWAGHEELRQLAINGVPKYGNNDDYADTWAAWVMDTWYDAVDWVNTKKDLMPAAGGMYVGGIIVANGPTAFGAWMGALPNGRIYPKALADTMSPVQGMDRKGPSAVIRSVSKMPIHRFAVGITLNQRLSPQLLATDRDLDNFVAFIRTCEELGVYHIQFNVISSELLRKAMREPENYKDLMVRVASYCANFVELDADTQMDIINRSEQTVW